jgi:hypothetical protein
MVDAKDLKSFAHLGVLVRVQLPAPFTGGNMARYDTKKNSSKLPSGIRGISSGMTPYDAITIARRVLADNPNIVYSTSKSCYVGLSPEGDRIAEAYNVLTACHDQFRNRMF